MDCHWYSVLVICCVLVVQHGCEMSRCCFGCDEDMMDYTSCLWEIQNNGLCASVEVDQLRSVLGCMQYPAKRETNTYVFNLFGIRF